jgi:hypothetical protein
MRHLIKISETKRELLTEVKPGTHSRKSRVWICFCVQYVPHSNGKSLVSVGASDFITL